MRGATRPKSRKQPARMMLGATPCGVRRGKYGKSGWLCNDAGCDPMRGATCTQCRCDAGKMMMRGATPCGVRRHSGSDPVHGERCGVRPHAGCDSKTRQNHHVPLHKTYIVYQIFISLALYLLMFFKQKIKIAQNSGAKSCVLL